MVGGAVVLGWRWWRLHEATEALGKQRAHEWLSRTTVEARSNPKVLRRGFIGSAPERFIVHRA
jgi:hypothetical protein